MHHCSQCGARVKLEIPSGEDRQRHVCISCQTIHYINPKVIAGCLVMAGDRVLLCRRAIEPRYGKWTLPAGFMECEETTEQAAVRETWEEARAQLMDLTLYGVYSITRVSQVYLIYLARLDPVEFAPGPESLEVALFHESEIPWNELAFKVMTTTLRHYYQHRKSGVFTPHSEAI